MNEVEVALFSRLSGTAALTTLLATPPAGIAASIYRRHAPQSAALPYVVFEEISGRDDNKSPHRARQLLYSAKAITATSGKDAGAIFAQIDAALHELPLTITGWTNTRIWLETDLDYEELISGGKFRYHRGGIYRLRIAK